MKYNHNKKYKNNTNHNRKNLTLTNNTAQCAITNNKKNRALNNYQQKQNKKHRTLNNYKKLDTCHNLRNPLYGGKALFIVKNSQNRRKTQMTFITLSHKKKEKNTMKKHQKKDMQYLCSKTVKEEDEPSCEGGLRIHLTLTLTT